MKRYPRIGTRIVVVKGEYAGRQGRTEKTVEGRGRIEITLLGGASTLGIALPLDHIESDPDRAVRKLDPVPLKAGDQLVSLTGLAWPVGHFMTILRERTRGEWDVRTDYGREMVLRPTPGFEKRWARLDGYPLALS